MMRSTMGSGGAAAILALGLLAGSPALAQEDLKGEVEALKKGQQEILKQLQEIRQMLQGQARPSGPSVKDVSFDLVGNAVKGDNTAKLTIIEFTDYQ